MEIQRLTSLFKETRSSTEKICSYLKTEDFVVQPVEFVSPPKWHLGHSSWFFEEFILKKLPEYSLFDSQFSYVFNSYYESVGARVIRTDRGNLSRPTVAEILDYRKHVTSAVLDFLQQEEKVTEEQKQIVELGIHHEKQHQELLITDIKYILGNNPLFPKYNDVFRENPIQDFPQKWQKVDSGLYDIGHQNPQDFCYDNELGRHQVFLEEFEISNKLITNKEYLEFIEDGGYEQSLLWHSEGWEWISKNGIFAPLYWHKIEGKWHQYTLNGLQKLILDAPLSHISYYEAFAFAQWKKMRLPTEFEWEIAQKNFDWGSRWEWTSSAYLPYPGFSKAEGAIGEYNGKFMVNQMVLRGGSIATAPNHSRHTYRNFFQAPLRWQFTGIRLVK